VESPNEKYYILSDDGGAKIMCSSAGPLSIGCCCVVVKYLICLMKGVDYRGPPPGETCTSLPQRNFLMICICKNASKEDTYILPQVQDQTNDAKGRGSRKDICRCAVND
jgi:hypothetical protein